MISDCDLPFFPKYQSHLLYDDKLRVTWFEAKFSQSYYNFQNSANSSNACTLIAVLVASKCFKYRESITINPPHKDICSKVILALAYSMLEGNYIHEKLKVHGRLKNINLTVPEALKYAETKARGLIEWKCMLYMEPIYISLFENLKNNWSDWKENHDEDLYVILITDSRSVLFYFNSASDTITLFDSHQHSIDKGACIAVVLRSRLKILCKWFCEILSCYYKSSPRLYELSFLYFQRPYCN